MKPLPILAGLCLLLPAAHAQEITAGGALAQEASWSALKQLVDVAHGTAKTAQITASSALDKATKIEACGKERKVYTPDVTAKGADANGCISTTPLINMAKCQLMKWKQLYGFCPVGHVMAGAETRNSDTGEWNGFYCCPLE